MQPVQPRPRIQYKQPSRLNGVTLVLALFFGLMGYAGYAVWPALLLRSNVESELADLLTPLWRLNHQPENMVRPQLVAFKRTVTERLRKVGVRDKDLQVIIDRNKKTVALEARFKTPLTIPVIDKTVVLSLRPRVETDAARVDW
jgi:hypothetical protein